MPKPIAEENREGYRLSVYQDPEPESPAAWGNNDVCGWNRYFTVENPHINKNLFGALIRAEGFDEYLPEAKKLRDEYHVFPIDAYVHSGVVLCLHGEGIADRWDTSAHVGCVIVSKWEKKSRVQAETIARGIITTWNQYLAGEVYGYVITKPIPCEKCGHVDHEEITTGWGIYGDAKTAMAVAREALADVKKT